MLLISQVSIDVLSAVMAVDRKRTERDPAGRPAVPAYGWCFVSVFDGVMALSLGFLNVVRGVLGSEALALSDDSLCEIVAFVP